MKRYKMEVKRALYRMGVRDARLGKNPNKDNPSYLRGYERQYWEDQFKNSLPF